MSPSLVNERKLTWTRSFFRNPTSLHRRAFLSLHGWSDDNQDKLNEIKSGFEDMRTVVSTVLQSSLTNPDYWWQVLGNYFWLDDKDDCDYAYTVGDWIYTVLDSMIGTGDTGDQYGSAALSKITLWEEDFGSLDKKASAYTTNEDNPRMHVGPYGFLSAWAQLGSSPKDKCSSLGDAVSEKMLLFATLVVHELTYIYIPLLLPKLLCQRLKWAD